MRRFEFLHVLSAQTCGPHSLRLRFNDGTSRRVNLLPALKSRGLVAELRDPKYFATFKLDTLCGTPEWPNGFSFAPEYLRELPEEPDPARAHGVHRNGRDGPVRRFRRSRGTCTSAYWLETPAGRRWAAKVRLTGLASR